MNGAVGDSVKELLFLIILPNHLLFLYRFLNIRPRWAGERSQYNLSLYVFSRILVVSGARFPPPFPNVRFFQCWIWLCLARAQPHGDSPKGINLGTKKVLAHSSPFLAPERYFQKGIWTRCSVLCWRRYPYLQYVSWIRIVATHKREDGVCSIF